jgi:GNAT superfamily N-acetyltransferase
VDDRHEARRTLIVVATATSTLPIAVRRARPDDRDAVLAFATTTWDGWDYIPEAWPHWIDAPDAVLLVATAQEDDRPIALTRVALLSPTEGWLEGIRVTPAVRGRGVATNLQVAELAWARAHDLRVLRYATGDANEGSLKLGAHGGFRRLRDRRTYGNAELEAAADAVKTGAPDTDAGPTRPDPTTEAERRRALLATLAAEGLLLPPNAPGAEIEVAWHVVAADPNFSAGDRLYELRPWALQELTAERFGAHARAGEVLMARGGEAVAILPHVGSRYSEDRHPHLAMLAGEGRAALTLLLAAQAAAQGVAGGEPVTARLPDPDPPMLADPAVAAAWREAGIAPHEWSLSLLARPLPQDEPLPLAEPPGALELRDPPRRVAIAPGVGA